MIKKFIRILARKYCLLHERAGRLEYIAFILPSILVLYIGLFAEDSNSIIYTYCKLFILFMIVPYIAVTTRRLHDLNFSGWWQIIFLFSGWSEFNFLGISLWIPWAQWLLIPLILFKGSSKTNRYGTSPRNSAQPTT